MKDVDGAWVEGTNINEILNFMTTKGRILAKVPRGHLIFAETYMSKERICELVFNASTMQRNMHLMHIF